MPAVLEKPQPSATGAKVLRTLTFFALWLIASGPALAQYDFLIGTEPAQPRSDQAFEVQLRSNVGCLFISTEEGGFLALEQEAGTIRATVGLFQDLICTDPLVNFGIPIGPYPAGNYRLELYGALGGNLGQTTLMDFHDFSIVEARVPQPAVIPTAHAWTLALLSGLALVLGWLRLGRAAA